MDLELQAPIMDLELQAPAKKKLDLVEDKVFVIEEKQVEKNSKV